MDSRYIQQFKKGSLEMILLCLIAKRETYGYEIILELNNNGASVLGYAKEGTVYPILYRLQQAELIKCRIAPSTANGGSKKYYSLTGKGRETLEELLKFWDSYTECVNGFIKGYTHSEKAKEHGESEQQVIERLGAPKEFVINTEEQFGVDHASVKKRRGIIHIVSSVIVAVVAFIVFGVMQLGKTPDNVIGQADAMTNIKIDEVRAIDPSFIFLLIGTVAIILIFFQMITFMRNNRRK